MKRNELEKKLKENGVPTSLYNLDNVGRTDERFCLMYDNNHWNVYFTERGIRTTDLKFSTEEEACQYVYEQLVY